MHEEAFLSLPRIHEFIHSNKKVIKDDNGVEWYLLSFSPPKNIRGLDVYDYRYIEQNPNTSSNYAARARSGEKITWLIYKPTNKWIGVCENGKVRVL